MDHQCAAHEPCNVNHWNDEAARGKIVALSFGPRSYTLNGALRFSASTHASEVRLYGNASAVLRLANDVHDPLITIGPGAPPVLLHGLVVHGVLVVEHGWLQMEECVVEGGNSAVNGGAVSLINAELEARDTKFVRNSAAGNGGAVSLQNGSSALFDNCLFDANKARHEGGALHVRDSSVKMVRGTLLQGNSAARGNSLFLANGSTADYTLPCPLGRWIQADPHTRSERVDVDAIDSDFPYACSPGLYGNSSNAQSSPRCSGECPKGYVCPVSTVTPRPCPKGRYCPGYDARGVGATAALPCKPGTYSNATMLFRAEQCLACPSGHACPSGSIDPILCSAGSFTNSSMAVKDSCVACPAGAFQSQEGQVGCEACPKGSRCPVGASAALKCDAGEHQDERGQARCKLCPAGHACRAGAKNATLCLAGSMVSADADVCELCYAGSYQDEDGQSGCKVCPKGAFCVAGAALPTNCSVANHAPREGMALCKICEEGTYQNEEGSSACKVCSEGFFCPRSCAVPIPASCDPGKYVVGNFTGRDDCMQCPAGHACAGGPSQPSACLPGTVAPSYGTVACHKCESGKYQSREGETDCDGCLKGHYCQAGAATPIPCEGGTYGNRTSLASAADCMPVRRGYWAPTGATLPERCFTGFRCPGRAYDRENDPPGSKPIIVAEGGMTTEVKAEVVVTELVFDATLEEYDEAAVRQTLASALGVPAELLLLSVRGGSLVVTLTVPTDFSPSGIPADSPAVDLGADILSKAKALDYVQLSDALGINVTSHAAPHIEVQVRTIEQSCSAGYWCTVGVHIACDAGFFNPSRNAFNATACIKCPLGSTTSTSGASRRSQCECKPTFYDADETEDGVDCQPCPVGTGQPGLGWHRAHCPVAERAMLAQAARCTPLSACQGRPPPDRSRVFRLLSAQTAGERRR